MRLKGRIGQRWKRRPRPRFPNFVVPWTWRGWVEDQTEGEKRAGSWKVGGKDEINSRVYGALKVAGISLTTWQTATVVGPPSGRAEMHRRSLARSLASARTGLCTNASSGYHSFALERAASRESSVNDSPVELLRNFTSARMARAR